MKQYLLCIAVYLLFIFALFSCSEEQEVQIERKSDAYYQYKIDSLEKEIKVLDQQNRTLIRLTLPK